MRILYSIIASAYVTCAAFSYAQEGSTCVTSIPAKPNTNVIEIQSTTDLTNILQKGKPVIVYFYAVWCGPCKDFKPIYHAMSLKYPDITFVMIDGDRLPSLLKEYDIQAYPTILFFGKGKMLHKHRGSMTEGTLFDRIQELKTGNMVQKPAITHAARPSTQPSAPMMKQPQAMPMMPQQAMPMMLQPVEPQNTSAKKRAPRGKKQTQPRRSGRRKYQQPAQETSAEPMYMDQYGNMYTYM